MRRLPFLAAAVALVAGSVGGLAVLPSAQAATPAVTVTETPVSIPASLPDDEGRPVALDGAVDVPSSGCPCPGVLINHGFLGTWHDDQNLADQLAGAGYVVLRYSSRGFGNTPGEVDLVGPKEVQDLLDAVHWLNNPANPVVGGDVIHNDIGQYGASYGGAQAWALALTNDPAVRTVVPTATWTNLYQSLVPNDVLKLAYINGFYATGLDPVAAAQNGQVSTTDNYSQEVHRWIAEVNSGFNVLDAKAGLDARSVAGRFADIHIPVFIIQGTNDGLFSQNQAVEAYQALVADGVPARLYIGGIGHPPSNSSTTSPEALHVFAEVKAWFDRYLKGVDNGINRMPPIEYSRAVYYNNTWDGTTRSAWSYPFGPPSQFFLCTVAGTAGGTLDSAPCPAAPPALAVNTVAGQGYDDEPVTSPYIHQAISKVTGQPDPSLATAPDTLTYDGPPLPAGGALDMAGLPALHLQVAAADELPVGLEGGAAAFQLDPKFYDVAPDGTATLITRGAFAEPLDATTPGGSTEPSHSIQFNAFGLSYLIPAGHHLRVTLSTEDPPYLRPTVNPFAVALFAGSWIDIPGAAGLTPTPSLGSIGPPPTVSEAPWDALFGLVGFGVAGLLFQRRRRTALVAARSRSRLGDGRIGGS
ncbi:MAG: CocE/NonD family hydrolase [Mycobacteriales bacterium]